MENTELWKNTCRDPNLLTEETQGRRGGTVREDTQGRGGGTVRRSLAIESSPWQMSTDESAFALGFETFHGLTFHQLL